MEAGRVLSGGFIDVLPIKSLRGAGMDARNQLYSMLRVTTLRLSPYRLSHAPFLASSARRTFVVGATQQKDLKVRRPSEEVYPGVEGHHMRTYSVVLI